MATANRPKIKREKLPDERVSRTWSFKIEGNGRDPEYDAGIFGPSGHLTIGLYPDGRVAELLFRAKEGSRMSCMLDAVAMCVSVGLQYGIPLGVFTDKLRYTRFKPRGRTNISIVPECTSPLDLIANLLQKVTDEDGRYVGVSKEELDKVGFVADKIEEE